MNTVGMKTHKEEPNKNRAQRRKEAAQNNKKEGNKPKQSHHGDLFLLKRKGLI